MYEIITTLHGIKIYCTMDVNKARAKLATLRKGYAGLYRNGIKMA